MDLNFPIVGGFNQDRFVQFSPEDTLNMFVLTNPGGKLRGESLQMSPGYREVQTLPIGTVVRENFTFENLYSVCSDRIYELDSNFTPTDITSLTQLNTSDGYVGISANQNRQILFVDGINGYTYDLDTSTFQIVSDPNFPPFPTDCAFLDGFSVVCSGRNIFTSQLNDSSSWTPVRAAQFNTKPDEVVAVETLNRNLYVFASTSTEQYYNAGQAGFPFRRNNSFSIDYGCASAKSVSRGHGKLFWLAQNEDGKGSVLMTTGGDPVPVSNEAIDSQIEGFSTISDAIGFVYKIEDDVFYQLTFPTEGKSFLYNSSLPGDSHHKSWSRLTSPGGGRMVANAHTFFDGKHVIGDFNTGKLFELNQDFTDANGETRKIMRISPHLYDDTYKRIQLNRFDLDMVHGMSDTLGTGSAPRVWLNVSYDGGQTFRNLKPFITSRRGVYQRSITWRKMGLSRDFVFKLEFYNQTPFMILGCSIGYKVLSK